MRNTVKLAGSLAVAVFLIFNAAHVAYPAPVPSTEAKTQAIVDVGNKICPVTGDKVNGKDFYEYKGKRYGLCCPMCSSIFASDPEKYSAIADKEVAGNK